MLVDINCSSYICVTKLFIMTLSKEAIERMEGLSSINSTKNFKSNALDIAADLEDEGFESDEIKAYLIHIVSNMIF